MALGAADSEQWDDDPGHDPSQESGSSQPLFLSVYLILLAFFMVLSMQGSFDQGRGQAVTASVQDALAQVFPRLISGRSRGDGARARRDAFEEVSRTLVDLDFVLLPSGDDVLLRQFRKANETMFVDDAVFLSEQGRYALTRLASALSATGSVEIEFLMGGRDPLSLRRAAMLDSHWPLIAPRHPAMIGIAPEGGGLTVRIRSTGRD